MKAKTILRLISLVMFLIAVIFVLVAMSCPTCGSVFYIGSFRVDGDVLHAFYNGYAVVMVLLFALSFLLPKN